MSAGGTVGSEHGGHRPANGLDELGPIFYYWRVTVQSNSQSNSVGGPDLVAMIDGWAGTGHGALPRRLAHACAMSSMPACSRPGGGSRRNVSSPRPSR